MKSAIILTVAMAVSTAAAAESFPDPLLTTPTSRQNVAKGLEADAYQLGLSAWVWGYPLVRMERVAREYTDAPEEKPATSYRAPLNQIGWARELATPAAKDMPTANNDTLYMSAIIELTEPYVLSVPDVAERYYVVNAFNMWQELEHYVGRRTTGTKAGKFAYIPPGWEGELPEEIQPLQMSTAKVWLWGRLRVSAGESMKHMRAIQDSFDLRPLSALGKEDWEAPAAQLPPLPDIGDDRFGFFTHLAAVLEDNQVKPVDAALFAQFERIGLTKEGFDPSMLRAEQRQGLDRALEDAPLVAVSSFASTAEQRNGWDYVTGLDDFGFNYALRAMIAGPYLGGQGELEALYPVRYTDANGDDLTGEKSYVIRFPSAPPNNAFWSLTLYDSESRMLVENALDRYKVGSDTPGFKTAADGSFEIPISHTAPNGEYAANWLPAPEGNFYFILRIYEPQQAVITGEWQLPQVELAQ